MRPSSSLLLLLSLLASLWLGACAPLASLPADSAPLFADARFAAPTERVTTADLFAVDAAMRRYLAIDIARQVRTLGPQHGLIDALSRRSALKLEYDAAATKTAAEAFATRSGNCLSLVVMTAALARELGLSVVFQQAVLDDTWSRNGDLLLASGHINVAVGERRVADIGTTRDRSTTTIDFLPPADLGTLHTRELAEATVVAMYANNRAAEALSRGRLDDAYAWVREAARRDPAYLSAYNTLGVVYLRHGDADEAERAFRHVLARAPDHAPALANLAETYARLGRADDAARVRAHLARVEPRAPFADYLLGRAAMRRGDFAAARGLFAKEVARADDDSDVHFWLGLAEWQLGHVAAARDELERARDRSPSRGQQDLYAAKLAWLQSQGGAQP